MPIPIGNYSNGYDLDGSGFEPIAGFEHLAGGVDFSQHFVDATTVQQDKKPTNSTQGMYFRSLESMFRQFTNMAFPRIRKCSACTYALP